MMVTTVNEPKDDLTMFLTLRQTQRERRQAINASVNRRTREILREIWSVTALRFH